MMGPTTTVNCPRFRGYAELTILCGGGWVKFPGARELVLYEGAHCCASGEGCGLYRELTKKGVQLDAPSGAKRQMEREKEAEKEAALHDPRSYAPQEKRDELRLLVRQVLRERKIRYIDLAMQLDCSEPTIKGALCLKNRSISSLCRIAEQIGIDWRAILSDKTQTDQMWAGDQECSGSAGQDTG